MPRRQPPGIGIGGVQCKGGPPPSQWGTGDEAFPEVSSNARNAREGGDDRGAGKPRGNGSSWETPGARLGSAYPKVKRSVIG